VVLEQTVDAGWKPVCPHQRNDGHTCNVTEARYKAEVHRLQLLPLTMSSSASPHHLYTHKKVNSAPSPSRAAVMEF